MAELCSEALEIPKSFRRCPVHSTVLGCCRMCSGSVRIASTYGKAGDVFQSHVVVWYVTVLTKASKGFVVYGINFPIAQITLQGNLPLFAIVLKIAKAIDQADEGIKEVNCLTKKLLDAKLTEEQQ